MKTQNPFALPIPPFGMHIVRCCIRDWRATDKRAGVERVTRWGSSPREWCSPTRGHSRIGAGARQPHPRQARPSREPSPRSPTRHSGLQHAHRPFDLGRRLPRRDEPAARHDLADDRSRDRRLQEDRSQSDQPYEQALVLPGPADPGEDAAMQLWCNAPLNALFDAGGIDPE